MDYGLLALALVILVIGYLLDVAALVTVGWLLLVVGAVLAVLALAGRSVFRSRRRP